jgi:hypothetical protein
MYRWEKTDAYGSRLFLPLFFPQNGNCITYILFVFCYTRLKAENPNGPKLKKKKNIHLELINFDGCAKKVTGSPLIKISLSIF